MLETSPQNHDDMEMSDDDIDELIEETELEEDEANAAAKLKGLRQKLKDCEEARRTELEAAQRAKADFLNSRKRLQEQLERDTTRSVDEHIKKLLPLCDSFTMAMGNTEAWEAVDETWRKGVEGIYNQLQTVLKEYGVSTIDPAGEPFNPNEHEAISTTDADVASDTVVNVVQFGYRRNDEVIRPAKVIISN